MVNQYWSEYHNNFIRQRANYMKDEQLAQEMTKAFGRHFSIHAIRAQRRTLGLKKIGGRGIYKIDE